MADSRTAQARNFLERAGVKLQDIGVIGTAVTGGAFWLTYETVARNIGTTDAFFVTCALCCAGPPAAIYTGWRIIDALTGDDRITVDSLFSGPMNKFRGLRERVYGGGEQPVETEPPATEPTPQDLAKARDTMHRIKDADHIFIISGTGAGKTTFATAVMQDAVRGGGSYFAIDGKPGMNWELKWPGASGKIKDPREFVRFLTGAVKVMEKRISYGAAQFPPLYIVIDEASQVTGKFEEAVRLVSDLSSRGREFNVHIWLMTQAGTVNEIGFEGSTPVLEMNFEALYLEQVGNGQRTFGFARFRSGNVRPFGERYITPNLPAPWADTENLPIYDNSREFETAVQPQVVVVHEPVQNGLHQPPNGRVPEVIACSPSAPVRVVQAVQPHKTESDNIRTTARWMIESMTEESAFPIGGRFLTVGESSAIFYLNQVEWTQNEIIEFVLGAKNSQRLAAVAGVLKSQTTP
jgi:hypothetical protein